MTFEEWTQLTLNWNMGIYQKYSSGLFPRITLEHQSIWGSDAEDNRHSRWVICDRASQQPELPIILAKLQLLNPARQS